MSRHILSFSLVLGTALSLSGCSDDAEADSADGAVPISPTDGGGEADGPLDTGEPPIASLAIERLFPTDGHRGVTFTDCTTASPLWHVGTSGPEVIVATEDHVVALHPETGDELYSIPLPAPAGEHPLAVSTPVLIGNRLVVAYHTTRPGHETARPGRDLMDARASQLVAVLDLDAHAVDPSFPFVTLAATKPAADAGQSVEFRADKALQRGKLVHLDGSGDGALGSVIVTFGNARDLQPWHGWAFALSLDAWKAQGAASAVTNVLLVTPEHDCGPADVSGSRARLCGGGLWAPTGPLVVDGPDGQELVLSPGNGKLDLPRGDYANTLLRTKSDLSFDPGCDEAACADFDPDQPQRACVESCDDVFVPRIPDGDPALSPESGVCDGLGMFACWEKLDYVGGSTPAYVQADGLNVLVYPTKDGHAYLVDADHLGTLYQRKELVKVCGTKDDTCQADWAGMSVAQPAVGHLKDKAIVVIPTFMPDTSHTAGVFGLSLEVKAGRPSLETRWVFPAPESDAARTRFREHPSQVTIARVDERDAQVAWIVEPAAGGMASGRLLALRLDDGHLLADVPLAGKGQRFVDPLVADGAVYTVSCESDLGRSFIEGHRFVAK